MKRILPPTLVWILLLAMVLLRLFWPVQILWRMPVTLLGILPLGAGLAVTLAAWNLFRRQATNINTFGQPNRLITSGIYHFSRNPMYLGMALILAGAWILLGGLSPALGVLAFIGITDRWYIAFEEKAMHRRFGPQYEIYKGETRRWI
jgi:protein-S-isoprenylcysteine O-methyltransferase Ste14